jgi:hypothetical protein
MATREPEHPSTEGDTLDFALGILGKGSIQKCDKKECGVREVGTMKYLLSDKDLHSSLRAPHRFPITYLKLHLD